MKSYKLTIVFSVFNEMKLNLLDGSLRQLSTLEDVEVIVVDGGSSDGTVELVECYPVKLFKTNLTSRAKRLNFGIEKSTSDYILLNHPRSILSLDGIEYLLKNSSHLEWGGFYHQFIEDSFLLKFTSWYSNEVRGKICSIVYLDHCIFFKKSLVTKQPIVPDVEIFEDTKLSQKFRCICPAVILPYVSKTSAIRFSQNGTIKQILLNFAMKICFYLNMSDEFMNEVYERGLGLNTRYKK